MHLNGVSGTYGNINLDWFGGYGGNFDGTHMVPVGCFWIWHEDRTGRSCSNRSLHVESRLVRTIVLLALH